MTYGDLSRGVVVTKDTQHKNKKRTAAGIDQAFHLTTSKKARNQFGLRAILALVIVTAAQGQNFPTVISTVAGGGASDNVPATTSPVAPASVIWMVPATSSSPIFATTASAR